MDKQQIKERMDNLRKLAKDRDTADPEKMISDVFGQGVIDVDVRVPLKKNGRDFFNLKDSVLREAEKNNYLIRFNFPEGTSIFRPDEWRQGAEITFQKFNYNTPLKLIGNYLLRE